MIDVVVINNSFGLERTLFSIYIQTIKNKIKVHVVSKKTDDIVSKFKDRLDIEEIVADNISLGEMRNIALNRCKNTYITFMKANDVFYDVFALNNIYKFINDNDAVFGKVVNNKLMFSNNYIEGNLYKRQFLLKNKINFFNSNSGDNGFNKLFLIYKPNITFSNDLIYHMKNFENNWDDFCKEVMDDTISSVKIAEKDNCDKKQIAKVLYDTLLYIAYLYDFMDNKEDINLIVKALKSYCVWYLKYVSYLDENDRLEVSSYYNNDVENDFYVLNEMLSIVK